MPSQCLNARHPWIQNEHVRWADSGRTRRRGSPRAAGPLRRGIVTDRAVAHLAHWLLLAAARETRRAAAGGGPRGQAGTALGTRGCEARCPAASGLPEVAARLAGSSWWCGARRAGSGRLELRWRGFEGRRG
jgi:hypothetical protein